MLGLIVHHTLSMPVAETGCSRAAPIGSARLRYASTELKQAGAMLDAGRVHKPGRGTACGRRNQPAAPVPREFAGDDTVTVAFRRW